MARWSGWCQSIYQEWATSRQMHSQHRVDVGHGTFTTSVYQVGWTADRHVCYIHQQTTDQVCIAIFRPQGRVDRHDVHYLGQLKGPPVCVPAIQVGLSGAAEDLPVSRSANDSGSSQARNSFLVSGASGTVARRSDPTVRHRSALAHPRRHSARRRDKNTSLPAVKSTRVETLRAILRAKGHSMSEVIISVHISCIYSETDCFHRPSHVCGFCAALLEVWSCSGSAHQAAHQGIQAGTTCATPKYA